MFPNDTAPTAKVYKVSSPGSASALYSTVTRWPPYSTMLQRWPVEQPKKKALLLGINNTLMDDGEDKNNLKMAHRDVRAMASLLASAHNRNMDIQILPSSLTLPSIENRLEANIIAEMNNLVADARRGDRFFFHCTLHYHLTDNLDHTEEDGKDECLVPCDSNGVDNNLIKDDELRNILVDRLPPGCQLIAVLDSCHSGSLLDLKHFRCNRPYIPWVSKGRRKSDEMRNNVSRRNATIVYQATRISDDRVKQRKTAVLTTPRSYLSFERRPSSNEIPIALTSPANLPALSPTSTSAQKVLARALTTLDLNAGKCMNSLRRSNTTWRSSSGHQLTKIQLSKTIKSHFVHWLDTDKSEVPAGNDENLASEALARRCESPVEQFCNGWCPHSDKPQSPTSLRSPESPKIISLAACKDSQEAWEDSDGHSMTQMLVEILKQDPHPTLKDLMITVSHKLHDAALQAHTKTKHYKNQMVCFRKKHPDKARARSNGDTFGLNMNNFQDPQLSSQRPLDMGERWNA
ncbi:hypothetical protein BT96DRAFT_986166 [Gymnopus androsaceus JB14]|uniref:Peptidase C14 caspase domain-containing protein n=1 Tax=Gymnopus androsaceus JB14 TaxID=1447944 RepID=A0A6A4IFQ1_9AGAR|nr:hypothetical protein BT96DRAFT_986166 [Gymnopus androsaceus JB14]